MESYITKKFRLSPFLVKFFEICGINTKEAVLSLKNENFLSRLSKYFIKHIEMFQEFYEYLGIDPQNIDQFPRENSTMNILDLFKPGDVAMIQAIQADVQSAKSGSFMKKSRPKTSRYVKTDKLIKMTRNVLKSFGETNDHLIEVEIQKQTGKYVGIVHCKVQNCKGAVTINLKNNGSWINSNYIRHLKGQHKLVKSSNPPSES